LQKKEKPKEVRAYEIKIEGADDDTLKTFKRTMEIDTLHIGEVVKNG
jgi:hypothetical protein